jgi:hypothetical protein
MPETKYASLKNIWLDQISKIFGTFRDRNLSLKIEFYWFWNACHFPISQNIEISLDHSVSRMRFTMHQNASEWCLLRCNFFLIWFLLNDWWLMMMIYYLVQKYNTDLTEPGRESDTSCTWWNIQNGDFLAWTWSWVCVETIQKYFPKLLSAGRMKKLSKFTGDPD